MPKNEYVSLDDYEIRFSTERAIGIVKAENPFDDPVWIPRSVCESGDDLNEGDTDIVVARWKADELDLDY